MREAPATLEREELQIHANVMAMACDMQKAKINISQLKKHLEKIADDMQLNITVQHEKIFKMMHRV